LLLEIFRAGPRESSFEEPLSNALPHVAAEGVGWGALVGRMVLPSVSAANAGVTMIISMVQPF